MIKICKNEYILFGAQSSVFVSIFHLQFSSVQKPVMCNSVTSLNFNIRAVLVVMCLALVLQSHMGESQTCPASLSDLQKCFPYVNSGAPPPAPDCCAAIKNVDLKCLCSTTQIATKLPSKCNLPPISCPTSGEIPNYISLLPSPEN